MDGNSFIAGYHIPCNADAYNGHCLKCGKAIKANKEWLIGFAPTPGEAVARLHIAFFLWNNRQEQRHALLN